MSKAIDDVLAERADQISRHGYTPKHDAAHDNDELILGAVAYALASPNWWPSDWAWPIKLRTQRENLVRAAAMLIAQIEALDYDEGSRE